MEQIRAYNNQMSQQNTDSEIMTLFMLINQAEERCLELTGQIANRRDLTTCLLYTSDAADE